MRGNTLCHMHFLRNSFLFQFTPLHERQPPPLQYQLSRTLFQFTPLHERQRWPYNVGSSISYFNSRLYMRGNLVLCRVKYVDIISIHASTWEAAFHQNKWFVGKSISIHASTWEAADDINMHQSKGEISIHASTWEAAIRIHRCREVSCYFNSRLYMRGSNDKKGYGKAYLFQFTPLHERQQQSRQSRRAKRNFNSRLYMRGSRPEDTKLITE